MNRSPVVVVSLLCCLLAVPALAARKSATPSGPDSLMRAATFSGLELRSIGPAFNSGRVIDLAVAPNDPNTWYVAAASGGVWKTTNAGTTWQPVFDDQGSYSIGCVTLDPKHPMTVWVGSGENNGQRSVGYGDGVYKSVDGGRHWANTGLKGSEHIGMIAVDPRDGNVVYVAAQGPLWNEGGERGLYKTTDGGRTWTRALNVDERTGISEVRLDPRDPDVIYAAAWQRHRRVWGMIDGGPGSAIYKSLDAGKTWNKLVNGLPKGDLGRIGLALAPSAPDIVYAVVETADTSRGVFRSEDGGANFEKVSGYNPGGGLYYQELFVDPVNPDRVYSMDVFLQVSQDGGRTWRRLGERSKHVDNHVMWIDSSDTRHLLVGCDGGLYQSFDRGNNWQFFPNLPLSQFYNLCVDDALPFYNVYGGTQDNNTLGGPSRTLNGHGIRNSDWFVTVGGDGFQCQVDPEDPNIVYSESQHAGVVRFDRRSGEQTGIQPQEDPAEMPARWNWDTPLVISPHSHTRLYMASQRVWRSEDRGDSWKAISPDLTRQLDRNRLKVAGRVWGVDAVAKNQSTSFYGNIVSFSESPKREGLLYVGTDDGLVQVSEDGGGHWRREERFPGVPELSYVSRLTASQHAADVVYAAFDNHKMGDYRPYLLRSADRGVTWQNIAGDLPARGSVLAFAEDPVNPGLLFAGTEFGLFFTVDGGHRWVKLEGGMPTIPVKDIVIQKRENDLVIATFGRGFYVLDDYSALRDIRPATLEQPAQLFPVRTALSYVPDLPLGGRGKASQGEALYEASNPPFGAVFTYYLRKGLKTRRETRRAREAEMHGGDVYYPSWDSLKAEDREEPSAIVLTVMDAEGHVVRRVTGPTGKGFHRVAWSLRYPPADPVTGGAVELAPWALPAEGPLAAPGTYSVKLEQVVDGETTPLAGPVTFQTLSLANLTLPPKDASSALAFEQRVARLQRAVLGSSQAAGEAVNHVTLLARALEQAPAAKPALLDRCRQAAGSLRDLQVVLDGDAVMTSRNEPAPASLRARVARMVEDLWRSRSGTPATDIRMYDLAAKEFAGALARLQEVVRVQIPALDAEAETAGTPWTPGRVPDWKPE